MSDWQVHGAAAGATLGWFVGGLPGAFIGGLIGSIAGQRLHGARSERPGTAPAGARLPEAITERRPSPPSRFASFSTTADEAQLRANIGNLPDAFWRRLVEISYRLGFESPAELAKIIETESKFDPRARNPRKGFPIALGLNQMIRRVATSLGMPAEQWERMHLMAPEDQILWVERYFDYWARVFPDVKWNRRTGYLANFAPGRLLAARQPDSRIYSAPSREYALNRGFDTSGKGYITLGDLTYAVGGPLHPAAVERIARAA